MAANLSSRRKTSGAVIMAKYFRFPWAVNGDKAEIPDPTQTNGAVSYQQGYGASYQADPETDPNSRDIERTMYNQALFDITSTLQQYYQRGVPEFITAANNGGVAFNYQQYARVLFNSRIYESLTNNNTTEPTNTTNWRLSDFGGLDLRYALRTDIPTLPTLGTAATRNTGTAAGNVPLIGALSADAGGSNSAVIVRGGNNANGSYRVWSDGFIELFGDAAPDVTFTYPIPLTNRVLTITLGEFGTRLSGTNDLILNSNTITLTSASFTGPTPGNRTYFHITGF